MMAAVIACNGIKIICMALALFQHSDEILVTLGDVLSSYLQNTDPLTENKCLIEAQDVKKTIKTKQAYALPDRLIRTA